MLMASKYPKEYIASRRLRIAEAVAAYKARPAADDGFESVFFDNMLLVLELSFVHRGRGMEGKDGNPLNEVRVIAESLLQHDGVMTPEKTIKLAPEKSVLKIPFGEQIKLTEADFACLNEAFFAQIEQKFV